MTDHYQMAERRLETWCTPITGYGEYEGLSGGTTVLRLSMTWTGALRIFRQFRQRPQPSGAGWATGAVSSGWIPSGSSNESTSMPREAGG